MEPTKSLHITIDKSSRRGAKTRQPNSSQKTKAAAKQERPSIFVEFNLVQDGIIQHISFDEWTEWMQNDDIDASDKFNAMISIENEHGGIMC